VKVNHIALTAGGMSFEAKRQNPGTTYESWALTVEQMNGLAKLVRQCVTVVPKASK
jgi:hypothetical protein